MSNLPARTAQRGVSLIEALVAILIFSIGVLALIALQATSIRQSADAKYRSEASLLASEVIGQMWISDRTPAALQANFQAGGGAYNAWLGRVQATLPGLAASAAVPASAPTVAVSASGVIQVDLFWRAPNEEAAVPQHRYTVISHIR